MEKKIVDDSKKAKKVEGKLAINPDEAKSDDKANAARAKRKLEVSSILDRILETKQGKTYFSGVLTVLIVVVLIVLAIVPALGTITDQVESNSVLQERVNAMTSKLDSLLAIQTKQDANNANLNKFAALLSEDRNQDLIYEELLQIVESQRLEMSSITFSKVSGIPREFSDLDLNYKAQFQAVKLSVVGNLNSVSSLVKAIELEKRIYDIDTIVVTQPEGREDNELQIELTMRTIYWDQEAEQI